MTYMATLCYITYHLQTYIYIWTDSWFNISIEISCKKTAERVIAFSNHLTWLPFQTNHHSCKIWAIKTLRLQKTTTLDKLWNHNTKTTFVSDTSVQIRSFLQNKALFLHFCKNNSLFPIKSQIQRFKNSITRFPNSGSTNPVIRNFRNQIA